MEEEVRKKYHVMCLNFCYYVFTLRNCLIFISIELVMSLVCYD